MDSPYSHSRTLAAIERESFPPSMPGPRTRRASLKASHASHILRYNTVKIERGVRVEDRRGLIGCKEKR